MPSYRIFKLDPKSKWRSPGEWVEADNDDDALAATRSAGSGAKCEVWLKDRLVGVVLPQ